MYSAIRLLRQAVLDSMFKTYNTFSDGYRQSISVTFATST